MQALDHPPVHMVMSLGSMVENVLLSAVKRNAQLHHFLTSGVCGVWIFFGCCVLVDLFLLHFLVSLRSCFLFLLFFYFAFLHSLFKN